MRQIKKALFCTLLGTAIAHGEGVLAFERDLGALAKEPLNTELLDKLRADAADPESVNLKPYCLYISSLGYYAKGDQVKGLEIQKELSQKFPTNNLTIRLPREILGKCEACGGTNEKKIPCPMCHGDGTVDSFFPKVTSCPHCRGKKTIVTTCDVCRGRAQKFSQKSCQVAYDTEVQAFVSVFEKKRKAIENSKKDFFIEDFGARKIDDGSEYVTVTWRVKVKNNTANRMRMKVDFKFLDADDSELESGFLFDVVLPASESETFSSQTMFKKALWQQVKTYSASVKPI